MAGALNVNLERRWKAQLEKDLAAEITPIWKSTVRAFAKAAAQNNPLPDPDALTGKRLRAAIRKSYEATSLAFKGQMGAQMPAGLKPAEFELDQIADALARHLGPRVYEQAELINATTTSQMNEVLTAAREESRRLAGAGVQRSAHEEAAEASAHLARKFHPRSAAISSYEVQSVAELSKMTEIEVLTGVPASIEDGFVTESEIIKTWWSQGDDVVRPEHLEADQQERTLDQPFNVGGYEMMRPGDQSLGAPIAQTIHCRCSSVVDEDAVADLRREKGFGV